LGQLTFVMRTCDTSPTWSGLRALGYRGCERFIMQEYWKWNAQGRFAGAGLNCGHYFALARAGADAEARFSGLETADHRLMKAAMRVDRILDLTSMGGIRYAFEAVVDQPDFSEPFIAEEYVEADKGGTMVTDRVGHWAADGGYKGILFLGTRAIHGPQPDPKGKLWDYDLFPLNLDFYRQSRNELSLVLFRGACVTTSIRAYCIDDGPVQRNRMFGWSEEELDRELSANAIYAPFDLDYQHNRGRFFFDAKIRYVKKVRRAATAGNAPGPNETTTT
jgi:hypothetical protein